MTLTIKVDLTEVLAMAQHMPELNTAVKLFSGIAMEKSLDVAQTAVAEETPVNYGALRASVGKQTIGSPFPFAGEVFSPLDYASPVEFGRKPGRRPPTEAIEAWVIRKLGYKGKQARSVAFLIARAIGRRGTRGAFMFKRGFAVAEPVIIKIWESVPAMAIQAVG